MPETRDVADHLRLLCGKLVLSLEPEAHLIVHGTTRAGAITARGHGSEKAAQHHTATARLASVIGIDVADFNSTLSRRLFYEWGGEGRFDTDPGWVRYSSAFQFPFGTSTETLPANRARLFDAGEVPVIWNDLSAELSAGRVGNIQNFGAINTAQFVFNGSDAMLGGSGPDTLCSYDGSDTLVGGGGADRIEAGAGTDTIRIVAGDVVAGEVGRTGILDRV